jgi:dienelactone hydrolase
MNFIKAKLLFITLFFSLSLSSQNFDFVDGVIKNLKDSSFEKVFEKCHPDYKLYIKDISSIIHVWTEVTGKYGQYVSHRYITYEIDSSDYGIYQYYQIELKLQYLPYILNIYTDMRNKITNIGFLSSAKVYTPPLHFDIKKIKEIKLKVGFDSLALNACLTIPKTSTKSSLVIIIGESGPTDKDFDYEPNKPYKDLAYMLSQQGFSVLRYDKRSVEYNLSLMSFYNLKRRFTPEEEYIFDINKIITQMKARSDIDTSKIYLLGHGQGGLIASYMAKNSNDIKGVIMIGSHSMNTLANMVEQYNYLKVMTPEKAPLYNDQTRHAKFALNGKFDENTPRDSMPFMVSPEYWIWMNNFDHVATTKQLNKPVLIINFGRDYQTGIKNYEIWQKKLKQTKDVSFLFYPKLNHIMMEGENPSEYYEYYKKGNIPDYISKDIADWLYKNKQK